MQYVLLATSLISVAVLIVVLIKLSKLGNTRESEELSRQLSAVEESLRRIEQDLTVTSTRIDELSKHNSTLNTLVDSRLSQFTTGNEKLTKTVEDKLTEIRTDNEKRLEQMRQTVEEKLQNIKTRGMWGELQAERILQEILLPEQYLKNVVTKRTSRDPVEFAVRLPGANEGEHVLLPIDSKFPREDYEKLCEATQTSDLESVRTLRKALERRILDESKDIREKYIDVPSTTDFAILFLPIEGLYAEILSIPGLPERVQHDHHVMIAGPATLASLLNSLQMGFRTLAIEKKSSEVWHVLGEVKTEYGKFGSVLDAVRKKLASATNEIDNAYTRHRAIGRKLRDVEAVESDSPDLLPEPEEN